MRDLLAILGGVIVLTILFKSLVALYMKAKRRVVIIKRLGNL